MLFNLFNQPSEEIQYLGTPYTQDCLDAIGIILQTQIHIEKALLLSCNQAHAYLIKSHRNTYIIRSGFRSGYPGEGPKGLASSLQLLLKHNIAVDEINISEKLMKKINHSSLPDTDIEIMLKTEVVRPTNIYEYIYEIYKTTEYQVTNDRYYPTELPYHLIDSQILDLALKFNDDPNRSIFNAFIRLENIVQNRINSDKHSSALFEYAFCSENRPLICKNEDKRASQATGRIFPNIYKAFRNEHAHNEVSKPLKTLMREFLLINELYILESEAIQRS
ncbi:TIGR02391 family protein [Acinetobacter chinensis]|uniref:TIGR02391 family protein n=1 Tax=Acinetobacter chinensis TaxID=2004650 RepID=A0A3B7M376_9GAMM|nr:TIGR02391 family protein [Acinetobacter chinensis]AXY57083.1 TIGR02391 family protein [Acinetobacter chinensis]